MNTFRHPSEVRRGHGRGPRARQQVLRKEADVAANSCIELLVAEIARGIYKPGEDAITRGLWHSWGLVNPWRWTLCSRLALAHALTLTSTSTGRKRSISSTRRESLHLEQLALSRAAGAVSCSWSERSLEQLAHLGKQLALSRYLRLQRSRARPSCSRSLEQQHALSAQIPLEALPRSTLRFKVLLKNLYEGLGTA
jgi:hypothetical protein